MKLEFNNYNRVCLLDNLLRPDPNQERGFIYTAIEEPIKQASMYLYPDVNNFERGLTSEYSETKFRELCKPLTWIESYYKIPDQAEAYLASCIPQNTLVVGYESPPWLEAMLSCRNIPYIFLRIAPFRFARDLYIYITSNIDEIGSRLGKFSVSMNELRIEAGLLKASAQQKKRNLSTEKIENCLVFMGQTKNDASIISRKGEMLTVLDFQEKIQSIASNKNIVYKPHPYDKKNSKQERYNLEKIIGKKIPLTNDNIYEILTSKSKIELISISSGSLQEAYFFNKRYHLLHEFVCTPYDENKNGLVIRFMDLLSCNFWELLLGKEITTQERSLQVSENVMRKFYSAWWGYSEYHIKNDSFHKQSFKIALRMTIIDIFKSILNRLK